MMRTTTITAVPVLAGLLLTTSAHSLAQSHDDTDTGYFQVFLGVLELDSQTGESPDAAISNPEVKFGSLPSLGIESEHTFYRGWVHAGLNSGGSVAWKNDGTRISAGFTGEDGAVIGVEADNSFLLAEFHLGAYVRGRLQDKITAYAAGGPMLLYGYHEVKDGFIDGEGGDLDLPADDASDINLGFYARAGIDFEYRANRHMGLGVRYLYSELDFDDTVGKIDIEGVQWVFTFSRRF
ncbi:MAG: hypothetical protein Hals2KO_11300 [Halioglobus sp.]